MITTEDATLALGAWGARLGPGFFSIHEQRPDRLWLVEAGDGQRFVLKRAREMVGADTLDVLRSRGIPVAPPIAADDGDRFKFDGAAYWTLYEHLPGVTVTDHLAPGASERAVRYGEAIGHLHVALASISGPGRTVLDLAGVVRDAATSPPIAVAPDLVRIWQDSKTRLPSMLDGLPTHLIHRDPNPANMLFERGILSGWVDFDLAMVGPRIFDPCYCASAILSQCPEAPELRAQWSPVAIDLLTAYDRVVHLTAHERGAVGATLMAIQILFAEFSHARGRDDLAQRDMITLQWLDQTWSDWNLLARD